MNKTLKGYVLGILTASILTGGVALAKSGGEIIESFYSNIKIYVDGVKIEPKDSSGNSVEPFIYNGTTYLPVRAIGEAIGKKVTWDGNEKSVWIGEIPGKTNYLDDVCPPYEGRVYWTYTSDNSDTITIGGKKYTNAFAIGCDHSLFGEGDGYALFNLNGEYNTLIFDVGRTDEYEMQDVTLNIYLDGKLEDSYELNAESLSKHITLDLDYALQLKLEVTGGSRVKYGFINAVIE